MLLRVGRRGGPGVCMGGGPGNFVDEEGREKGGRLTKQEHPWA